MSSVWRQAIPKATRIMARKPISQIAHENDVHAAKCPGERVVRGRCGHSIAEELAGEPTVGVEVLVWRKDLSADDLIPDGTQPERLRPRRCFQCAERAVSPGTRPSARRGSPTVGASASA